MEPVAIRFEPAAGKRVRVIVGDEDVVLRMKRVWEDSASSSRGIVYKDLVIDSGEITRSAAEVVETTGKTVPALVFNCGDCGLEGCIGVDPVQVTNDGYEVHWRIAASDLEAPPLEFSFDKKQYLRAVSRIPKPAPKKKKKSKARKAAKKATRVAKPKKKTRAKRRG